MDVNRYRTQMDWSAAVLASRAVNIVWTVPIPIPPNQIVVICFLDNYHIALPMGQLEKAVFEWSL